MSLGVINLNLVKVAPSKLHGLGAFANTHIPEGTIIGPYKGKYMTPEERSLVKDGTYIWKINEHRFVDAKNHTKNNPLRYVNGAKTKGQKKKINMVMMNIGKTPKTEKVYYMAVRNIPRGEELIISYGNNYF